VRGVLSGKRGDGGTLIKLVEWGDSLGALSGLRASAEGGGAIGCVGVRRGGRAWKDIEGEDGGSEASQKVGGERLDTWRGEKLGARTAMRGV
jgi:hypothetical protein